MTDLTLEARIDRIEAHIAIQQLAARYARAVDSRDIDALSRLYTPDIDFSRYGFGKGPAGAAAFFDGILTRFYRSMHQLCGHVIDITDADHATGTVYCRVEHEDGGDWIIQLMTYFDRYRRVDGVWLIDDRRPNWLYTGDARDLPQDVNFVRWPSRPDAEKRFAPALPHIWPSWNDYWARHQDEVAAHTRLP